MSNKAVKKQVKKRIKKRKTNNLRQMMKPDIPQQPSNSLREQMQNRFQGTNYPFGLFPQQYGNVNNERNLNQLRTSNQAMSQQIGNDKAVLDYYNQEKVKLEKEIKGLKKQRKDAKSKYESLQEKYEMEKDNLSESERIESKMQRLQNQMDILNKRKSEIDSKNGIIPLQQQLLNEQFEVKMAESKNAQLNKHLTENDLYHKYKEVKQNLDITIAEHKGLQEAIKSPSFQDPQKYLKEQYEEKAKLEMQNSYLKKMEEVKRENIELNAALASIPSDEIIKDRNESIKADIQKQLREKFEIEKKLRVAYAEMEAYKDANDYYKEISKESARKQRELLTVQTQLEYLDDPNNVHYLASEREKETAYLEMKIDEEKENIEQKKTIRNRTKELTKLEAQNEELNKPISQTQTELLNEVGKKNAVLEQVKSKKKVHDKLINTIEEVHMQKAQNDYENTPEYLNEEYLIYKDKEETKLNMKRKEQLEVMEKQREATRRSQEESSIAERIALGPNDNSLYPQILAVDRQQQLLNEAKTEAIRKQNEELVQKQQILNDIALLEQQKLKGNARNSFKRFLHDHSQYNMSGDYDSIPLNRLKEMYTAYSNYTSSARKRDYELEWQDEDSDLEDDSDEPNDDDIPPGGYPAHDSDEEWYNI